MEIISCFDTIFKQVRILGPVNAPLFVAEDIERILEEKIHEGSFKYILVNGELVPRMVLSETELRKVINDSKTVNAEKVKWFLNFHS